MNKFLILLILSFLDFQLKGQYVQHWGERDGLSNHNVNSSIRTSDGFLWIGTNKGLDRFDGYAFLPVGLFIKNSLSSNLITQLFEIDPGKLWVATDNGINVVNLKNNLITDVYRQDTTENSLSDNYVMQIYQAPNKTIWVSTSNGILHKYIGKGKFKRYYNLNAKDKRFGSKLTITAFQNYIWLKTPDRGVYKVDPVSGNIIQQFTSGFSSFDEGGISVLPKIGLLWMRKDSVKVFNTEGNQFENIQFGNLNDISTVLNNRNGDLWIVASNRKKLYFCSNNGITDVSGYLFDYSKNVQINSINLGLSGDLWISTNNGLYKLIIESPLFKSILTKYQINEPFYVPSYKGMIQDSLGEIFIGGYGGLYKISANQKILKLNDRSISYISNILIDDNNNYLWAISEGHGILHVNKKTGSVIQVKNNNQKYNYLMAGMKDTNNVLLLGGNDALFWYYPFTHTFLDFKLQYEGASFQRPMVRYIYRSKNNFVWICTQYGIFVLDKSRHIIARYFEGGKEGFGLPVNRVNHLNEDRTGKIWAATEGGGACRINWSDKKISVLNKATGLTDNTVEAILEDSSGMLWLTTYNGISVIEPKTYRIKNYFQEDGLSDNEFNPASCLKAKDGRLFFGGINGINIGQVYQPISYESEPKNKINFSKIEFLIENNETKEVYNQDDLGNGLVLPYESSFLYITFFNSDFYHSDKNIFYYRIEELNKDWLPLGEKNFIRFASLTPGKYTLHIKGKSAKTNMEAEEAILRFEVLQVFYKRWWFILILLSIIISLYTMWVSLKIQRVKELTAVRSKISSDLHDEVGSALTRVAMLAEFIEEDVDQKHREVLKSIVNSCRMAISSMRDVIWSMDGQYYRVGNLFDKITEMVQQTMEYSPIQYTLEFDPELYRIKISQINKQEIFFIVKEAFHNIVKHSQGNLAELKVFRIKNELVFIIANTGKLPEGKIQTGSGMNNMVKRAERIRAKLVIDTSDGYLIKLTINLKQKLF